MEPNVLLFRLPAKCAEFRRHRVDYITTAGILQIQLPFNPVIPSVIEGIRRIREERNDVFVICIAPISHGIVNIDELCGVADLVLDTDYMGMRPAMVRQAKTLGPDTFVHYSHPRNRIADGTHTAVTARMELIREEYERSNIHFIDTLLIKDQRYGISKFYTNPVHFTHG